MALAFSPQHLLSCSLFARKRHLAEREEETQAAAQEQKTNNQKGFKVFNLKAKARTVLYVPHRGTSLARKRIPRGPYRRPMPRVVGGFCGGRRFLMGEVPLYPTEALP